MSITGSAPRLGVYCELVNGGSDYKTVFIEGRNRLLTEGLAGQTSYTVLLDPNQRAQFVFGVWANGAGKITANVGSIAESGTVLELPIITIRRVI